ncbi:glycosyltransferase family 2 protein [Janibacter anophelis]|uniref:glycosyltransferase family 2 protein n=1 Tax=Janibacter anophelis TaxID=319054 RepID=UPI003F8145DC
MPRLSILSAVRNEETHIREMIESLRAQGLDDWELVLVDDGSSDRTVEIISGIAKADPRVILAAQQDAQGKVSAFNRAFAASSGGIVCLMGGDDRIPSGGLAARTAPFDGVAVDDEDVLALFKLRTFSDDAKFDGMILPRGDAGSRSGGVMTMTRSLAEKVFPIPDHLVAEDVFLGEACESFSPRVVTAPDIVLEYRIHSGNTNPRHQGFDQMTRSTHKRAMAWLAVLEDERLELGQDRRQRLEALWSGEQLRMNGDWRGLLRSRGLPFVDRLAMVSKSNRLFYGIRSRFYRHFSGWRGA